MYCLGCGIGIRVIICGAGICAGFCEWSNALVKEIWEGRIDYMWMQGSVRGLLR